MKGTRHNGRSGKDGVYNPLHNDQMCIRDSPKGTILVECGKMLQRGAPKSGKDGKPMKDKHGKVIYCLLYTSLI